MNTHEMDSMVAQPLQESMPVSIQGKVAHTDVRSCEEDEEGPHGAWRAPRFSEPATPETMLLEIDQCLHLAPTPLNSVVVDKFCAPPPPPKGEVFGAPVFRRCLADALLGGLHPNRVSETQDEETKRMHEEDGGDLLPFDAS
ncbi:unnamed protein product [Schistocephalus solidus]|uniref:Uncharacterized protein n=1 Tax=Schistocephalus solidus TaxID=70667 RepID=A0A0X3NQI7_SCHSO|nr:unnamed protein product [Schistocephalus solidus]